MPTGPGDLAIVDLLSRRLQVLDALPDIVDPNCQLEPERDRFRVDSVGAAGHESVFVLDRPAGDCLFERCEVFEQDIRRIAKPQRQCRIDDVIRRQPDVDVAGVLAYRLCYRRKERDYVVLLDFLEFVDSIDIDGRAGDIMHRLRRNLSGGGASAAHRQFDVEPQFEFMLFGPDPAHFWERVSC